MEIIRKNDQIEFSNSGVISRQLLSPHNSLSERITVTEVIIDPGSVQPRHLHKASEQILIVKNGTALLLLADDVEIAFTEGDVVRFSENDIHGLENSSNEPFQYIAITSPPLDFKKPLPAENN